MAVNLLQYGDPYGLSDNPLAKAPPPSYDPAAATQPDAGTPTLGAAVASGVDALGQWLAAQRAKSVQMGLLDANTGWPTQAGAVDAARQFGNALLMGTTAPGDVPPPGILAYHGSPHSFDQFDSSKIGTGEGNQSYGHGLYFAEKEGTAQSYRDALATDPRDTLNNYLRGIMNFHAPDDPAITADAIKNGLSNHDDLAMRQLGGNDAAIKDITTILRGYDPNSGSHSQAAMDAYGRLDKVMPQGSPGSMYQVNIGADPEHFLDWDKPLSEQHPKVQQALGDLGIQQPSASYNVRPVEGGHVVDYQTGDGTWSTSRVYKSADDAKRQADITMQMMNRDPTGEQLVKQNPGLDLKLTNTGLPGIRYLDQGSRGAGQGTHNYVVFDAATIDILRKYGIAGLIAGGGAAAATQQKQPSQ